MPPRRRRDPERDEIVPSKVISTGPSCTRSPVRGSMVHWGSSPGWKAKGGSSSRGIGGGSERSYPAGAGGSSAGVASSLGGAPSASPIEAPESPSACCAAGRISVPGAASSSCVPNSGSEAPARAGSGPAAGSSTAIGIDRPPEAGAGEAASVPNRSASPRRSRARTTLLTVKSSREVRPLISRRVERPSSIRPMRSISTSSLKAFRPGVRSPVGPYVDSIEPISRMTDCRSLSCRSESKMRRLVCRPRTVTSRGSAPGSTW